MLQKLVLALLLLLLSSATEKFLTFQRIILCQNLQKKFLVSNFLGLKLK